MFYFDVCTGCAVREDSAPFLIGWLAYRLELRAVQPIGTIERGSITFHESLIKFYSYGKRTERKNRNQEKAEKEE